MRPVAGIVPVGILSARHRRSRIYQPATGAWRPGHVAAVFQASGLLFGRISKIYHMGVPGGIEVGSDGADDPASWTEAFNSQGPEWKAPGRGETLEGNAEGKKPVVGGNTFVVVAADGDDLVHSDGKTASKACELLAQRKEKAESFFLAVGFVRPHVPFVSPAAYHESYAWESMVVPEKVPGDWDDIPKAGINYKTSANMRMTLTQQKKAVAGYYAAVSFMDAQVGRVLDWLDQTGLAENTIVIFTSDHGYHLGEHDFWAKVSLHEESAKVPLIISVPGKKPGVSDSFVELLDLFPTTAQLCGLEVPARLQGKDVSVILDEHLQQVRETAFSLSLLLWRDLGRLGKLGHLKEVMAMDSYTTEFRGAVLQACDANEGTRVIAVRFAVSESWVRLIKQQRRETGQLAPKKAVPSQPKWHAWADWLVAKIIARPDIYLRELQADLRHERQVDVCLTTICNACRALGQTRKKRHSSPASKIAPMSSNSE